MADRILKKSPNDVPALYGKAVALAQLRKFKRAFALANRAATLVPTKAAYAMLALQTLASQQSPRAALRAWAKTTLAKHPGSPVFMLTASLAQLLTGRRAQANTLALKLAAMPTLPTDVVLPLVRQLDNLGHFAAATRALKKGAAHDASGAIAEAYCQQMLLQQHNRAVVEFTTSPAIHGGAAARDYLLAYRTLALIRLKQTAAARLALAALKKQTTPAAQTWATVLDLKPALKLAGKLAPKSVQNSAIKKSAQNPLPVYISACNTFPNDPYFVCGLGDAFNKVGEAERAAQEWQAAAHLAPAWPRPLVRLATAMASQGRFVAGANLIHAALRYAPHNRRALVALAFIRSAGLQITQKPAIAHLLKLVQSIEKRFPNQQNMLPLQVKLLAMQGQTAAAKTLVNFDLRRQPPLSASTFMLLAAVDQRMRLGLRSRILAAAQRAHGATPQIVLARAIELAQQRHPKQGLSLLKKARAAAGAAAHATPWNLAWAQYLGLIQNPGAAAAWIRAANAAPASASVQWMALSAPAVQADRVFVGATIGRLQKIIGKEGFAWKLAQARYLLQERANKKNIAHATTLLMNASRSAPDVLMPHVLLAACYRRDGNIAGAIDQLQIAAALAPHAPDLALQLANLYQLQRRFSQAAPYLVQVGNSPLASASQKRTAALLLARQGKTNQAVAILRKLGAAARGAKAGPRGGNLLLAQLYQRQGNVKAAAAQYALLLKHPQIDGVLSAANFYASVGRGKTAVATLKLLNKMRLKPGGRSLLLGDFFAMHGQTGPALTNYERAAKKLPNNAAAQLAPIHLALSAGLINNAREYVRRARKIMPKNPAVAFIAAHEKTLLRADAVAAVRPLVALVAQLQPAPAARRCALAVGGMLAAKPTVQIFAKKIKTMAAANPTLLPLQQLAVQALLGAHDARDASAVALRTMQNFPQAAGPAHWAAVAFAAGGHWGRMLSAAKTWRARLPATPFAADVSIATAYMHLNEPTAAYSQIKPYLKIARLHPRHFSSVILLAANAEISAGKISRAATLVFPLAQKFPGWRMAAMQLAAARLPQALAASWLKKIGAMATPGSAAGRAAERLALGRAWFVLASRVNAAADQKIAVATLQKVLHTPGLTAPQKADVLSSLGTMRLANGKWRPAEALYRQALVLNGKLPLVKNNLAMILLRNGGASGAQEALQLAAGAVKANPNIPTFWDTLGRVQAHEKLFDSALKSLRRAVVMQPTFPEWRIDLASALLSSGNRDAARRELHAVSPLSVQPGAVAPQVRARYERVKHALAARP